MQFFGDMLGFLKSRDLYGFLHLLVIISAVSIAARPAGYRGTMRSFSYSLLLIVVLVVTFYYTPWDLGALSGHMSSFGIPDSLNFVAGLVFTAALAALIGFLVKKTFESMEASPLKVSKPAKSN